MKPFFDTNVIVYAQQADTKGDIARGLLEPGGTISVQVLNEFTNVLLRKHRKAWSEVEAVLSDVIDVIDVINPISFETHGRAVVIARDHNISFYDALIIAAAIDANCDVLFSEDLQHGRKLGGVEIVNPFR